MSISAVTRQPPRKRSGEGLGPRTIDGTIMDMAHGAAFLGVSKKMMWARVARRTVPFRYLGRRVVFLKTELEEFLQALDGVKLEEALANLRSRAGVSE